MCQDGEFLSLGSAVESKRKAAISISSRVARLKINWWFAALLSAAPSQRNGPECVGVSVIVKQSDWKAACIGSLNN